MLGHVLAEAADGAVRGEARQTEVAPLHLCHRCHIVRRRHSEENEERLLSFLTIAHNCIPQGDIESSRSRGFLRYSMTCHRVLLYRVTSNEVPSNRRV